MELKNMSTETRNKKTMDLDIMSSLEIVQVMNSEDTQVPLIIKEHLNEIAHAVDWAVDSLSNDNRIFYLGAGTSGRLGVLDAAECLPTFGVPDGTIIGLIAGGESAMIKAVEGAEDNRELGKQDLVDHNLNKNDLVIGLAASGRTPYVIGALNYANEVGCNTVAIACNNNTEIGKIADVAIEVAVGPEILTGSTRLKAGTAQKLILNMISTASMVQVGKAYQNLMVDVVQSNEKLVTRAQNIVMAATGVERAEAKDKITASDGSVKLAIVMILADCSVSEAKAKLSKSDGKVREAIKI